MAGIVPSRSGHHPGVELRPPYEQVATVKLDPPPQQAPRFILFLGDRFLLARPTTFKTPSYYAVYDAQGKQVLEKTYGDLVGQSEFTMPAAGDGFVLWAGGRMIGPADA